MRKTVKFALWLGLIVLILAAVYFFIILPPRFDARTNPVKPHAPYSLSDQAKTLHADLRVADLHADTLLWKRNPAKRHDYGQTDLPRLREGGLALQVFAAVTYVPAGMNETATARGRDNMIPLTIAQAWPPSTWTSPLGRARYQAKRLRKLAETDADLRMVRTAADLKAAMRDRAANPNIMAAIMAAEGAHPLEGQLSNIDIMYEDGYRLMGLQHFFDNELGGSLHGVSKDGLTDFGKAAVRQMIDKGMIIDVAHSSVKTVEDVMALTNKPIAISHTGIVSLCNHPNRNIPDRLLQNIAGRGGIIGIGYWEMAVCDTSPDGIAKMLIYGVNRFGADHIALGSDFDGAVATDFDTSELAAITDALLRQGMDEDTIKKVMGENLITFFMDNLPQ